MKIQRFMAKPARKFTVIGPRLFPGAPDEIIVMIALPFHTDIEELTCQLIGESKDEKKVETPSHGCLRTFRFHFTGLKPGQVYKYIFFGPKGKLNLQGGLTENDCAFRAQKNNSSSKSFIALSCHNPFEFRDTKRAWSVWESINKSLDDNLSEVGLLLETGDQVYNDDVAKEWISKLGDSPSPEILQAARTGLIENYLKFWFNISYRRVHARLPSLAIWDDHDIVDGYGGDPKSFNGIEIRDDFVNWFKLCREFFVAYQASPLRLQIPGSPEGVLSTYFDFGSNRFYLLDLRSEKNTASGQLISEQHATALFDSLKNVSKDTSNVFLVTPVVPFRIALESEGALIKLLKQLPVYKASLHKKLKGAKWFAWLFYFSLATTVEVLLWMALVDDLEDGLSSPKNLPTLKRILTSVWDLIDQKQIKVMMIAGDIHAGGLTRIEFHKEGKTYSITQLVASPVAHKPAPEWLCNFTTAKQDIILDLENGVKVSAKNLQYVSDRNYALITTDSEKNDYPHATLFFEKNDPLRTI